MKFKTLQSVRDHVAFIPEDQFTTGVLLDESGKMCVAGHLNMALRGSPEWGPNSAHKLACIGLDVYELVNANNADTENPKRGALAYLDGIINRQKTEEYV